VIAFGPALIIMLLPHHVVFISALCFRHPHALSHAHVGMGAQAIKLKSSEVRRKEWARSALLLQLTSTGAVVLKFFHHYHKVH
jgi:hypothetical protein